MNSSAMSSPPFCSLPRPASRLAATILLESALISVIASLPFMIYTLPFKFFQSVKAEPVPTLVFGLYFIYALWRSSVKNNSNSSKSATAHQNGEGESSVTAYASSGSGGPATNLGEIRARALIQFKKLPSILQWTCLERIHVYILVSVSVCVGFGLLRELVHVITKYYLMYAVFWFSFAIPYCCYFVSHKM